MPFPGPDPVLHDAAQSRPPGEGADRHAEAFTLFIERATRLVEPLLLLLVALVVGGIVVLMYMPIFDIASSVR